MDSGSRETRQVATAGPRPTGGKGHKPRVVVVMPAYNAARTLAKTHGDLPREIVDKVILVDDASQDDTVSIARQLGLDVIVHVQNKGYGGNQKTCYIEALNQGADIVVMLHPDNQYDATRIPALIGPILEGKADLVLGSRLLSGRKATLQGGMPLWKYVSNRFLTLVENFALGTHLSEAHTGFRAYSRRLLTTIPFLLNSDDFVFDSEVIAQTVAFGFTIAEVPVPTRYFPEASSVNFRRSVIYGLATLNVSRKFWLHKRGFRRYPIFRKRLASVLSREYKERIFGADDPDNASLAGEVTDSPAQPAAGTRA
ncbi:MAG: glycosyltransferase family 2 protein [Chloroflexota bacterium]|nr:glycosyltransferase family 2 protein [Chloroflexota bacterium]